LKHKRAEIRFFTIAFPIPIGSHARLGFEGRVPTEELGSKTELGRGRRALSNLCSLAPHRTFDGAEYGPIQRPRCLSSLPEPPACYPRNAARAAPIRMTRQPTPPYARFPAGTPAPCRIFTILPPTPHGPRTESPFLLSPRAPAGIHSRRSIRIRSIKTQTPPLPATILLLIPEAIERRSTCGIESSHV